MVKMRDNLKYWLLSKVLWCIINSDLLDDVGGDVIVNILETKQGVLLEDKIQNWIQFNDNLAARKTVDAILRHWQIIDVGEE